MGAHVAVVVAVSPAAATATAGRHPSRSGQRFSNPNPRGNGNSSSFGLFSSSAMARLRRQDCPRRRAVAAAAATGGVVGASDDRFGDVGDGPDPRKRADIAIGAEVDIVLKADQGTDRLTRGVVREFLTNSKVHHQGIKVRLVDGAIGRVQRIVVVGGGGEEQGGGRRSCGIADCGMIARQTGGRGCQ